MQYISTILIVFFFAGVTMANQDWKIGKFGRFGSSSGDESVNFDRYITNKRAINGQLRRSSIHWGKRTPTGLRSFERDIPLVPEDYLVMWPAPEERVFGDFYETTTPTPVTSSQKQQEGIENNENEEVFSKDNRRMERVAKGGIRPKLQLSSRLWGR
ncbi:hypothetical protein CAEBREN_19760 [Caenorhabditis brenneri]|uniref:Uncharacterized protein n=1 Tax=Caenorhabditis brenneri TaxID=135651 RepID=G0MX09_CAEBE|nr:hypothetical protein CAEBREN_19760 [Caenorhabditis brenneri]